MNYSASHSVTLSFTTKGLPLHCSWPGSGRKPETLEVRGVVRVSDFKERLTLRDGRLACPRAATEAPALSPDQIHVLCNDVERHDDFDLVDELLKNMEIRAELDEHKLHPTLPNSASKSLPPTDLIAQWELDEADPLLALLSGRLGVPDREARLQLSQLQERMLDHDRELAALRSQLSRYSTALTDALARLDSYVRSPTLPRSSVASSERARLSASGVVHLWDRPALC
jgi:hypothetical protein